MDSPDARGGLAPSFSADHSNFLLLLLTTPMSIFLVHSAVIHARFSGDFYTFIITNRPLVQLGVQIIANLLSISQIIVLCRLINFAVRRRFVDRPMSLDALKLWVTAVAHQMDWGLPWFYWLPLLLFMAFSTALRGLWAAALTPVVTSMTTNGQIAVPSWSNYSLIKEYPSEAWLQGPTLQNERGIFSYSIATQLRTQLLSSAASATTIDGRPREHGKLDRSRYTYIGRSYGMGSSAGLAVDDFENNELSLAYTYQEDGYETGVNCIYNETSEFNITRAGKSVIFYVRGNLPDTDDSPEWSNYLNNEGNSIVAMGVAHFKDPHAEVLPPRRYIGFAAGESYDYLDKIQCELDFVPRRFNVSVDIKDRHITVAPTDDAIDGIDPSRRLRGTALRQYELMANDETNMYVSMFGSAFNASITNLQTYMKLSGNSSGRNASEVVLEAVGNSVMVMMDDMLGAYAAAQLMVSDLKKSVPARLERSAISFGEFPFAVTVFAINLAILTTFMFEIIRTRWWKGLPRFDPSDVRMIAIAASEGGRNLGDLARGKKPPELGRLMLRYEGGADGRYALAADYDTEKEETTPILTESRQSSLVESHVWTPPVRGQAAWI